MTNEWCRNRPSHVFAMIKQFRVWYLFKKRVFCENPQYYIYSIIVLLYIT
jgi:hypothetical protein